jgi:Putative polyhydroxyalkanoic acid system protein (PHA_gran_rgn)
MSQPVVVTIPHRLGKEEAVRRMKSGFERARGAFAGQFLVIEENWSADRLEFRAALMGHTTRGAVDVAENHVRIEIELPWFLGMIAEHAKTMIEKQGQLMLEKK